MMNRIREIFNTQILSNLSVIRTWIDHIVQSALTLQAPITTAAHNIHIFSLFSSEIIRLHVSNESSAEDSHEKSSLIFFKDKSKKLKCRLLQFCLAL